MFGQRQLPLAANGRSRPSAADDRIGVGVGDAAESGRSPKDLFGEPEPQVRLPVSGRSCAPAIDPEESFEQRVGRPRSWPSNLQSGLKLN